MRWKYFCVRGEEIVDVDEGEGEDASVDSLRKIPLSHGFHEFGPDEMHLL